MLGDLTHGSGVLRGDRRNFLRRAAVVLVALAPGSAQAAPKAKRSAGKPDAPSIESRVIAVVSRRFKVEPREISRRTSLAEDLKAQPSDRAKLKAELEKEFAIRITPTAWKDITTVGQIVDHVEQAIATQRASRRRPDNAAAKDAGAKEPTWWSRVLEIWPSANLLK
ncbi:MAG: acyl carrier protein [Thermoguttaceae bacterium]|jgi:acyl carrier protein|nr:acyl carrier protein [Thermoguttaceae bacterium]